MQKIANLKDYIKSLVEESSPHLQKQREERVIYQFNIDDINQVEIAAIEQDSRTVKDKSAFFCLIEDEEKATLYINQALQNGASVVVANFDKISYNFQQLYRIVRLNGRIYLSERTHLQERHLHRQNTCHNSFVFWSP